MLSIGIGIVVLLFIYVFTYKARHRGTNTDGVRGKGSMPSAEAWDPHAQIINVHTDHQLSSLHNGLKTVVTFSDGYTYTTYFSKRESKLKLGGATYTYSVDAQCKEMITTAAIVAHSRKE